MQTELNGLFLWVKFDGTVIVLNWWISSVLPENNIKSLKGTIHAQTHEYEQNYLCMYGNIVSVNKYAEMDMAQ